MNRNKLRVLIVGCGNIAGKFDETRSFAPLPLTHAGAFTRDGRFSITACVDPSTSRRTVFSKAWNIPTSVGLIDVLADRQGAFDVISICSPTRFHSDDIKAAIKLKPKLIFAEKPVAESLFETEQLISSCEKYNILCAVNYSRRWDPDIVKLDEIIRNGLKGKLRSISGIYNKGLLNNGSHMLDLLDFLLGPLDIKMVGSPLNDWSDSDPSVPVWLQGKDGVDVHLACAHAGDYSHFELQFVFQHGVLTMEDGGMVWRERVVIKSKVFDGYRQLDEGMLRAGAYASSMSLAVDNIWDAVINGKSLKSCGSNALRSHVLCEKIRSISRNI